MKPVTVVVWGVGAAVMALLGILFAKALPDALERAHDGRRRAVQTACGKLHPAPGNPTLGQIPVAAPDFTLAMRDGRMVSLSSLRGEVVLVNFWATWCETCRVEIPSLEKLATRTRDRRFQIVAVSVDENWEAVEKFFSDGTPLSIVLDTPRATPRAYGTEKFPESFLVDRDGMIRAFIVSERDWSSPDVEECVEALMAE
jgi:thiol-disulfide isomerase/thioredoxin